MTEALPLVQPFFAAGQVEEIAHRIARGYKFTNDLMKSNLAFSTFPIGMEARPYILRPIIDFELRKMADQLDGFFCEAKWNAAHNCRSLHVTRHPIVLTQHFMGSKNYRQAARHAKCREPLAGMNLPLFEEDESDRRLFSDGGYIQFLHGGKLRPDFIALVIPTDRQDGFRARSVIPVPEVTDTLMPESIREELVFQLRQEAAAAEADQNNNLEEREGEPYAESG